MKIDFCFCVCHKNIFLFLKKIEFGERKLTAIGIWLGCSGREKESLSMFLFFKEMQIAKEKGKIGIRGGRKGRELS